MYELEKEVQAGWSAYVILLAGLVNYTPSPNSTY
jgi:hypothetical protein